MVCRAIGTNWQVISVVNGHKEGARMNVTHIRTKFGVVLSMTFLLILSACASSSATTGSATTTSASGSPPPAGYSKYLVYIANGSYNPKDPTESPPNGDYFF